MYASSLAIMYVHIYTMVLFFTDFCGLVIKYEKWNPHKFPNNNNNNYIEPLQYLVHLWSLLVGMWDDRSTGTGGCAEQTSAQGNSKNVTKIQCVGLLHATNLYFGCQLRLSIKLL